MVIVFMNVMQLALILLFVAVSGGNAYAAEVSCKTAECHSRVGGTKNFHAPVKDEDCMACHKHGTIAFQDEIRKNSAVFGEAEEQVRRLYPEKPVMDRLLQQDSDRFLAALEKAVGPFLREGADKQKTIREFPEPIGELARFYRLNYLDLKGIASELDLEDPQVIVRQVGETKLKRLGLDGLLRGGVVSRQEWEATSGLSLMQELARELRLTPIMIR